MKFYTINQYRESGCKQINDRMMLALHAEVEGRICDTGCPLFNNGNCKEYKKLIFEKKVHEEPIETVREEAKRCGLSIKQVRLRRRDSIS